MKFDLHVHSYKSYDSFSSIKDLVFYAIKNNMAGIAITDHEIFFKDINEYGNDNNIWIINGIEIQTEIGDILSLFISKPPKSKKARDLIQEIHDLNGIAILPHPFKYNDNYPLDILENIDAVEIVNSRWRDLRTNMDNGKVRQLLSVVKGRSAGSDSHFPFEIGRAYWETGMLRSQEELKKSLCTNTGNAVSNKFSLHMDLVSQGSKFIKNPSIKQLARVVYQSRHLILSKKDVLNDK